MSQNLFKIYDGRDHFWQWDTGQKLIVLNNDVDQVHFSNNKMTYAIVKEVFTESDGTRVCEVPDVILKAPNSLIAYAYVIEGDQNRTIDAIKYSVHSRQAPEDYTYEENNRFKDLVNKINLVEDAIENSAGIKRFNTIEEAELWAQESQEVGRVITINVDEKWTAYMVDSDHSVSKVHDNSDLIEYIDNLSKLIGNESVSDQIKNAIEALDLTNTYATKSHDHTKDDITDFAHEHEITDVTGLQVALDNKQPIGDYALKSEIKDAPVQSVNGKVGTVTLTATDVGAMPEDTVIPTVPTNVSAFDNDAGYLTKHQSLDGLASEDYVQEYAQPKGDYLTSYTETDPTVPAWAKEPTKPTYTASEVGALPDTTVIPSIEGLATEKYVDNAIAAIPTPDVSGQIEVHNTSIDAHSELIQSIKNYADERMCNAHEYSDKKINELVESGATGGMERQSITWDGNTEGLTVFEGFGLPTYQVSDKLIPHGEVTVTLSNSKTFPAMTTEAFGIVMLPELIAFSAEAGEYSADGMSLIIPETGTYFLKADGYEYATSISYEAARHIDQKFLPVHEIISMAKKYSDSKGGYVEPGKVVYDADLVYTTDDTGTEGVFTGVVDDAPENMLVAGQTYTVTTDSGSFTAECKKLESFDDFFFLGNPKILGGEDTGDSFACIFYHDVEHWDFCAFDFANGSHMKIVSEETIHPIDPKFLPDAVVKVNKPASVGQTIVVKSVDENGKPTEWEAVDLPNEDEIISMANEYTDSQRIAYVEDAKTVFETALIDDSEFPNATIGNDYTASAPWLEPGKTYTVITDSGTFEAVCREFYGSMILGNTAILEAEAEDTGETFICFNFYETVGDINGWDTICADVNKGTHMKIIADGTIHTIDPKYLPEAVITKDNLVTNLPEGGFGYTETERGVIFPETTFSTSSENSVPEFDIGYSLGLVEGKNYTIYYDGTSYDRTAYSIQVEGFGTIIIVGNDDDPVSFMEPSGMSALISGERGNHTYALHGEVEVVNPIDPKFLPDLTGRAGTIKTEKTVILPETTATAINDGFIFEAVSLTAGETYTVVFNGAVWKSECIEADGQIWLGNKCEATGEITREPFVCTVLDDGSLYCLPFDPDTLEVPKLDFVTLEIYQETEVAQPIDPKYLPGVCLPVVEITSAEYPADGSEVALSAEESAQFQKAIESGKLCIITLPKKVEENIFIPYSVLGTAFNTWLITAEKATMYFGIGENGIWTMGG